MLVAIAMVLLSAASSSSLAAVPGQVSHYRLHGAVAEAGWARTIGTDFVGAYVQASNAKSGRELVVEMFHDRYDQQGRFLGSTVTHAAVTSGYAFTIDKAKLDAATVDATGVPATLCRFDGNWDPIGPCGATTLIVHSAWTGQGLIARSMKNDHYRYHGFGLIEHSNGGQRNAAASGIIDGVDVTRDFLFATLSTNLYGSTTICLHGACWSDCPMTRGPSGTCPAGSPHGSFRGSADAPSRRVVNDGASRREGTSMASDTSGARKNLALATIAFTICFTSWGLVAPLAKHLQDPSGWSDTQVLLLAAVPVLCGSLLRIPAGWLADRFGGRLIFTITMLLSILPAILLGYVTDYGALLLIGFFMGAAGSAFAVGVPFVVGWYERSRQGFAVGVYALGTIGPAIALLVVPRTLERYGQAYLGWGMAAILVLGAGMMWFLGSDAPNPAKPTRYGDVVGAGWRLWQLALLYFLTFGAFVAMFTFLQKLLTKWFALSDVDAGARAAGFAAVAVAARPVGGWLADRYGGATVLTAAFAGIAVDGAVLAAVASHPTMVTVSIACLTMGVFLGLGSGAVFKLVPQEFPENPGAATGIVGAIGGFGGFFPPVVMGLIKGWTGSFALGFVGLLVFCIVCFAVALTLLIRERMVDGTAPVTGVRGA